MAPSRTYARLVRRVGRTAPVLGTVRLSRRFPTVFEWSGILLEALLMYVVVSLFVVQAYAIPSESMYPTLQIGDRIFVNKFIYWFNPPQRGDIVVFRTPDSIYDPEKPNYVKRIVGLPGDLLEIHKDPSPLNLSLLGPLYVNGHRPPEDSVLFAMKYSDMGSNGRFGSVRVPDDQVYCFGDNTLRSSDSRSWGGVPVDNLKGKAFFRFWPPNRFGPLE